MALSLGVLRNLVKFNAHHGGTCHQISNITRHLSSLTTSSQSTASRLDSRQTNASLNPAKHTDETSRGQIFRILSHTPNKDHWLDSTLLAGSNVELADLECQLESKSKIILNLTWLRDSCHCDQCTHRFSRQRLFLPKDFKKHLFQVKDVKLVSASDVPELKVPAPLAKGDQYLSIKWADGHQSFYSLDWLELMDGLYHSHHNNDNVPKLSSKLNSPSFSLPRDDFYSAEPANKAQQECWTVSSIRTSLAPVDYHDLVDGFKFRDDEPNFINSNNVADMTQRRYDSMLTLTSQLTRFGLAKIVNVPLEREQVLRVARSLAYERPTGYGTIFDVVVEPSEEINLAYSSLEFDLHTDLPYREKSPGVQLLHCIRNSVKGGLSYFTDAFQAAQQLRHQNPKLFQVLLQFPAIFVVRDPYRDIKFRKQQQMFVLDQQGELSEVNYSPFMLPAVGHRDDLKLFYLALDKYTQLLQAPDNKLVLKMDPGDLFIFNNRRVLHGRSAYDPTTSNRFLQGCYIDWDEIECLHEKLYSNNNKFQ